MGRFKLERAGGLKVENQRLKDERLKVENLKKPKLSALRLLSCACCRLCAVSLFPKHDLAHCPKDAVTCLPRQVR